MIQNLSEMTVVVCCSSMVAFLKDDNRQYLIWKLYHSSYMFAKRINYVVTTMCTLWQYLLFIRKYEYIRYFLNKRKTSIRTINEFETLNNLSRISTSKLLRVQTQYSAVIFSSSVGRNILLNFVCLAMNFRNCQYTSQKLASIKGFQL